MLAGITILLVIAGLRASYAITMLHSADKS